MAKDLAVVRCALEAASRAACACIRERGPSVIAIGKFDGIHRGHAALLSRVNFDARRRGWQGGVVTFDRHPREVLNNAPHAYLASQSERESLCAQAGMDFMLLLRSSAALFAMEAPAFADALIEALDARMVIVGANFRFGRGAKADAHAFATLTRERGIEVVAVPLDQQCDGDVSSTRIRQELAAGRIERVAHLLGRPFAVHGTVTSALASGAVVRISPQVALPMPARYLGSVVYDGTTRQVPIEIEVDGFAETDRPLQLLHLTEVLAQPKRGNLCRIVFDRSHTSVVLHGEQ